MTLTKSDLQAIDKIVARRIEPLDKGQKKIVRELNRWTKFFDRDYVQLLRRVVKIENKLNIPTPEF